jgi:outer membrane biosynthesis protein TonB
MKGNCTKGDKCLFAHTIPQKISHAATMFLTETIAALPTPVDAHENFCQGEIQAIHPANFDFLETSSSLPQEQPKLEKLQPAKAAPRKKINRRVLADLAKPDNISITTTAPSNTTQEVKKAVSNTTSKAIKKVAKPTVKQPSTSPKKTTVAKPPSPKRSHDEVATNEDGKEAKKVKLNDGKSILKMTIEELDAELAELERSLGL